MIALGSEAWDPISAVVGSLCQAMHKGHWLVLENCHLMPHWPKELLQPLLGLLDGAKGGFAAWRWLLGPDPPLGPELEPDLVADPRSPCT